MIIPVMAHVVLEVVCASVEEAAASVGADRIELCAALPTGGVTPTLGMIEEARQVSSLPIVAMVRPREGGPCPPEPDFQAAVRDVQHCVRAGADEIVCGFLAPDGRVDRDRNRALVEAAEGRPVAFHRVFDMVPDLDEALEDVIECGFVRILTSGGQSDVDQGFDGLVRLRERAAGRVTILPGGGVRPTNVKRLADAGFGELHFSFRAVTGPGYGGCDDFRALPDRIADVRRALGE